MSHHPLKVFLWEIYLHLSGLFLTVVGGEGGEKRDCTVTAGLNIIIRQQLKLPSISQRNQRLRLFLLVPFVFVDPVSKPFATEEITVAVVGKFLKTLLTTTHQQDQEHHAGA